jgi:hypothetical protein
LAHTWSPGEYSTPHYHYFLAVAQALIYRGDGIEAWRTVLDEWPRLSENFFLVIQGVRSELMHLRGRAALAAAAQMRVGQATISGWSVAGLCSDARRQARALRAHGGHCALGWAQLLDAGVHRLEGRGPAAAAELRAAIDTLEKAGMALYAAAARYALSDLQGPGSPERARSLDFMHSEQVVKPAAMVRLLAPGL